MAVQQNYTNLDFDGVKKNLRLFLQSQAEFKDYNFEGSGMSTLLDVLAAHTQYNGLYFNMVASEMFLDSATRRSSVVSIAKQIGYTPRSKTSASAFLNIQVTPNPGYDILTLPAGTKVQSKVDNATYIFQTLNDYVAVADTSGQFIFRNVEFVEGLSLTHKFAVLPTDVGYTIPNAGVDTARLIVKVRESATSSVAVPYEVAENTNIIDGTSLVYFIEEVDNEKFFVRFGDGVLGKKVVPGNVVEITYFISSGVEPNGAAVFTLATSIPNVQSVNRIVTIRAAGGGSELESIESIKHSAPESYAAQNRAVTATDWKRTVTRLYPNAQSINVWGGEDNDPPRYGNVFISIKPREGVALTDTEKSYLVEQLKKKYAVLTITPIIVDPAYLNIIVQSTVKYDSSKTALNASQLESVVRKAITTFSDTDLENFDTYFKYSKFLAAIDNADPSIESNETTILLSVSNYITSAAKPYDFSFNNPISPGSVYSDTFTYRGSTTLAFVKDDGAGTLNVYRKVNEVDTLVATDVGTVDYEAGLVSFASFVFVPTVGEDLYVYADPTGQDIELVRNQVAQIYEDDIFVTVEAPVPTRR